MTVKKALVYTKGGGEGHLRRGSLAALWLHQLKYETTLVVREDQFKSLVNHSIPEIQLRHGLPHDSEKYDQVITDTFPQGWRNEFHPRRLLKNASLSLISRINRDENWAQESEAYDQLISPYPEALSEWE